MLDVAVTKLPASEAGPLPPTFSSSCPLAYPLPLPLPPAWGAPGLAPPSEGTLAEGLEGLEADRWGGRGVWLLLEAAAYAAEACSKRRRCRLAWCAATWQPLLLLLLLLLLLPTLLLPRRLQTIGISRGVAAIVSSLCWCQQVFLLLRLLGAACRLRWDAFHMNSVLL